jgi:YqxM protein
MSKGGIGLKKELRKNRRRRYKKMEKHGLFLSIKMALICYLAIFGISYMTSDTSAFYSDQSKVSQVITAGIWEDPEEAECGDEDAVSDNEINVDCENEEDELNVEDEKETEPENKEPTESEDKSNETENEKEVEVDSDAGIVEPQNPEEDDESVEESKEEKPKDDAPIEKVPEDSSDDETNTAVTKEEKTKKTEGDTNDEEESNVE